MSVGVMVIAYKFAFVFSIMFEMPYTRLSGLMWKRSSPTAAHSLAKDTPRGTLAK